jgi:chromosomal replication initiator protein
LQEKGGPTLAEITRRVAGAFEVPSIDVQKGGRSKAVVLPRQIAMYIARTAGGHRYKDIGRYFGGRGHSTVVHACQQIEERLRHDSMLLQQVQRLCDGLRLPRPAGVNNLSIGNGTSGGIPDACPG